ncbi:MAG: CopG family transcriptional regulator [Lentisphaerae bacterium]|nr:CopG family transcriptional regulator [Lentisphaerota bacterium]
MNRTQVQLTEKQSVLVKQLAAERHVSMSSIIRQGVDSLLTQRESVAREERIRRALAAAGRFKSDRSDVSRRHDAHLAEVFRA